MYDISLSVLSLEGTSLLLAVISAAAIITGILFTVSLVAYLRRRSRQYLLIAIAMGALWLRSIVGASTVYGIVTMTHHHLIEHALDVIIGVLVLYAVYAYAPGTFRTDDSS